MGKYGKETGSRLLGEELRKLRGPRTLKYIAQLSRSKAFAPFCTPVSAPTLSQIENGIGMPTVATLYTLGLIYRVSLTTLQGYLIEERVTKGVAAPSSLEEASAKYGDALRAGHWYDALTLAIQAERMAPTTASRHVWQGNRAIAMQRLGMRDQATWILMNVAESAEITPLQRFHVLRNLADCLASGGLYVEARERCAQALAAAPAELPPEQRARVLLTWARYYILHFEHGCGAGEDDLVAALDRLGEARQAVPRSDTRFHLLCDLHEALVENFQGCDEQAAHRLEEVARQAEASGNDRLVLSATLNLGAIRRQQGKVSTALPLLEEASTMAVALGQGDEIFEAQFELYQLHEALGARKEARKCLLACRRHFPLVTFRTPNVERFASLFGSDR